MLIHQAFAGPGDAGGTRHFEFARILSGQGHRFSVVTSRYSYLTGKLRAEVTTGNYAIADGVVVLPVWVPATIHRSFVWRVIAFVAFMITSFFRALTVKDVDVVLGTSPPIFQALSAWMVGALRRKPFVLEIRDLWPEFAVAMGVLTNRPLIWLARKLERFLYGRAALIIVNSPAYREYLVALGVPAGKISVVPNGVDPSMFDPRADGGPERREIGVEGRFVVTNAGALGMANDIDTILEAAVLLRDHEEIVFLLVGDGKERPRLEASAKARGLNNVQFLGAVPKEKIPRILAASDVCTATLMDIPMFRTTYPNKVFDYMAAGRPTILGIGGVIREVVESADGGIYVPPGDFKKLAEVILMLSQDSALKLQLGDNARKYVCEHFERASQARLFGETLRAVADGGS